MGKGQYKHRGANRRDEVTDNFNPWAAYEPTWKEMATVGVVVLILATALVIVTVEVAKWLGIIG